MEDRQDGMVSQGAERSTMGEGVRTGLTFRAFAVGLVLCVFLGLALTYNRMVIQGSFMNSYFMDRGAIFLFFCLVLVANPLLAFWKRRYALGRGELLAVYVMLLFLLSASGMMKPLISYLTGVTYYASPENRKLEAALPHILPWVAPQDADVVRGLYEGVAEGASMPWEAWVIPLWGWGAFLMVLYGVLVCTAVVMRRQWEEHERFAFPIMQIPLEMSAEGEGKIGPLFGKRAMWAGFAIPFLAGSLNGLNSYFYFVPRISLSMRLWIFRRTTSLPLAISFAILGYSYFVNLDVSLSIWVFNVISKIVRGSLAVIGVEHTDVSGVVGRFSSRGSAVLALMGMGYMLVLAIYSLWVAREHLREVVSKALGRPSQGDDSGELVSYRTALMGIGGGLIYMAVWLGLGGISPLLILFFLFACFVVFFVMARIVSETGFVATYSPINPSEFVVCAAGSSAFGPAGLVTLGFSYAWTMTRISNVMPHASGALRLAGEIRRKRGLALAMGAALAVGLVTAGYMTLKLGYTYGGLNLDRHFRDYAYLPFDAFVGPRLVKPSPIFYRGFLYTGLGAGIAALLTVLRTRLTWWPLHPVALPLSTIWYTDTYFFSVFLAWGIKAMVLKLGGAKLYQRTRPFFIGIILGEVVCAGGWVVVDYVTAIVRPLLSSNFAIIPQFLVLGRFLAPRYLVWVTFPQERPVVVDKTPKLQVLWTSLRVFFVNGVARPVVCCSGFYLKNSCLSC